MQTYLQSLKIYLDTCCYSRPYDDKRQPQILREVSAIETILGYLQSRQWHWITSEVIVFEVNRNPNLTQREDIKKLLRNAHQYVPVEATEELRSAQLESFRFKPLDALHIACAENANANILLTTDRRMLRRAKNYHFQLRVRVENPHIWLQEVLPMSVREIREVSMEEDQREDTELRALLDKIFQHEGGKGDYSIERHEWVDSLDLDTILKGIQELRDTEQND